MAKTEVVIEDGREKDSMTVLCKKMYDEVVAYNEKHKNNRMNILVLAGDNIGGSSFIIGDEEVIVKELFELDSINDIFRGVLSKIKMRMITKGKRRVK